MQDLEERLRQLGMRVTKPRRAVIEELSTRPHLDVASIAAGARERLGSVSTQGVYDVVHALTEAGILRSIELPGTPEVFELARGDNHHHLVCRSCGNITDVPCPVGKAPCLEPLEDAGYYIDEAEVTYWGLCPACRPADLVSAPHQSTTHTH